MKSTTISQDTDGKSYVSVLCEGDMRVPQKKPLSGETARGIDFGVKTFMTFDNGDKIDNPMFLKKSQDKLTKH